MSATATQGRTATAWCDVFGRVAVSPQCPADQLPLATGDAHVLWHHIEERAQKALQADGTPVFFVPGFRPCMPVEQKARCAQAFAHLLVQAGMTIRTELAPLPGGAG